MRGKIVGTLKFAFYHPIEAVFLAFLLWIALTGLTDANWSAVPQNGVAQTVIAGEQQSFHDAIGVHVPAIGNWALDKIASIINFTSGVAALWMAQFMTRFEQAFNHSQAQPISWSATPTPVAPMPAHHK